MKTENEKLDNSSQNSFSISNIYHIILLHKCNILALVCISHLSPALPRVPMQMHQWCTGAQGWCKFCTTPVQFHRQRRIHKEQQLAIVKPGPTTLAGCWDFSFTKSRLILASTDQPATASMLFNHQCNAATNFLSLTCIHNAAHRSNSWPVKSGNDRNQTFFSNLQCAGLSSYIDVEDFQEVEHCNYYQGLEYCHYHVRMNLLCNAFYPPKGKS